MGEKGSRMHVLAGAAMTMDGLSIQPQGARFTLLSDLVADVLHEVASIKQVAWASVGGVPVLVPVAQGRVAVKVPGESDLHAVEVPVLVAGLLICIFALEYGVFTDAGTKRAGVAAEIQQLKYGYLALLKHWCEQQSETMAGSVLELVE